jgi:simple sugar transport system permease protein
MVSLEVLGQLVSVALLQTSIALLPPYVIASIGETVAERAGVINIGIEGILVLGAFLGFFGQEAFGSPLAGFIIAALGGMAVSLILGYWCISLKINQIVTGLGVFFVGFGLASYLQTLLYPDGMPARIDTLPDIAIPGLSEIPILGVILFEQNYVVYLSFVLVAISYYVIYHTRIGREIRAVGMDPSVADSMGVNVSRVRYACVAFNGLLIGIAGAYLTQAVIGRFNLFLTGGQGFIILAIVIVGLWDPRKVLAVAIFFSVLESVQFRFQDVTDAPVQLLLMLPYIATILILLAIQLQGDLGKQMPDALTVNYERGDSQ